MTKSILFIFIHVLIFFLVLGRTVSAGISVDAGLTPAEDRWIFRSQLRYMQRENYPGSMSMKMNTYAFMNVLAYGLRPHLTLMARQTVKRMQINSNMKTGLDDLFLMTKYKIFRRNTRFYNFGAAATLGLEFPTGEAPFTSETWDLKPGLYISWIMGPLATDFNVVYEWIGFADLNSKDNDPGDQLSIDVAMGYQITLSENADMALAPVLELSSLRLFPDQFKGNDVINTGESVMYIAPGIKLTIKSFIIEALAKIPVWQEQKGSGLKHNINGLARIRLMF